MARMDVRRPGVWVSGVLALALIGLIVFRVIQASAPAEAAATVDEIRLEQGMPVAVAAVERGPLSAWRSYNGSVSGTQEGVVRARSGDQIVAVAAQVGARVSRGQTLVQQAGEASAARVRQAEAAAAQARRSVERLRPLHEAGAISDQEWEMAQTQHELASADVAAARDLLTLTSPLSGIITEVSARTGMIPTPGDALVRVADLSELIVYLRVSAADAAEIQQGQRARTAEGSAAGRVHRIALQADPVSRLVEIEVAFPPTAGLIPGTLASVQIETGERADAISIPRAALRDGAVWTVAPDGSALRKVVEVGLSAGERIEIVSGLEPGEQVVVDGGSLLSDGTRLRIVDAGEGER